MTMVNSGLKGLRFNESENETQQYGGPDNMREGWSYTDFCLAQGSRACCPSKVYFHNDIVINALLAGIHGSKIVFNRTVYTCIPLIQVLIFIFLIFLKK